MPTSAVKAAKSVSVRELKADSQRVGVESPQKELAKKTWNFGTVLSVQKHPGSPTKNGSRVESEPEPPVPKMIEVKGPGPLKQLISNGSGSNDAASSPRQILRVGAWGMLKPLQSSDNLNSSGKIPIVVRKAKTPEENGKPYPLIEQLQKKMKLSTVPKVVPLINTVGNQSKLIPLTFSSTSQSSTNTPTTAVNSLAPLSQSKLQKRDVSKPMSILEATLTSVPKDSVSTDNTPKSKAESSSPPPSDEQCSKPENSLDKGVSPSVPPLKSIMRPTKCVISYEKGVTKLVAIERRAVTMVDVAVQVYIPELDADNQGILKSVPPNAVSSETGSIQPQTTSTLPLHQKPYVVVDKNGKKVIAIPKQVLSTYGGAKKIVFEGKGIKRKAESSIESLVNDDSNGTALPKSVTITQRGQPTLTSYDSSKSNPSSGKTLSDVPPDASLSFETLTTSSCRTLSSTSSSQQNSCNSSDSIGAQYCDASPIQLGLATRTVTSNKPATILLSQTPNRSHVITSDSLVLPLDSPVQFDGKYDGGTSLQETICVPSSSKTQTFPNNSDSIILPLNSPIGTQPLYVEDSSMNVLQNYFIVMPNVINGTSKVPDNMEVEHEMAIPESAPATPTYSPLMDLIEEVKAAQRIPVSLSSHANNNNKMGQVNSTVAPKRIPNSVISSSNNLNGKDNLSVGKAVGNFSESNTVSSPNGVPMSSKSDIENLVKSALSDFKQCLSMNTNGQYPIHAAVESNNIAALKRQCLVLKARRASVDIRNSRDETPLQLAVYYGHTPCIKVLLDHGADGKFSDLDGNTSLHLAVLYADDGLKFLLAMGRFSLSFINSLNDEGFSALHLAAQNDKVEAINLLIKFGADVDLPDGKSGRTALFHAVERKNYKSQQILEACDANVKKPTFTGSTPFSMTRTDAIAQLASGQNTFGEIIDSDTLLKPRRPRIGKVL